MAYPTVSVLSTDIGAYNSGGTTGLVTSVSASVPASTGASDTRVLLVAWRQKSIALNTPSGWTLVGAQDTSGSNGRLVVLKQTGVFAAGSITLTFGGSVNGRVHALSVNGNLDAYALAQDSSFLATATTPTVTATGAETVWVQGVASAQYPRVLTAPTGTTAITSLIGHNYIIGFALATRQVGAGATGASGSWGLYDTEVTTTPSGDAWAAVSLIFSIASTGGGGGATPTSVTISGGGELPVSGGTGGTSGGTGGGTTSGGTGVTATGPAPVIPVANEYLAYNARLATEAQSTPRLPDIPALPAETPIGMRRFLEPLREYIQVIAGRRGSELDTAVTFRDLISSGIAQIDLSKTAARAGGTPVSLPVPGELVDFSTPPAPTALTVNAAVAGVILQWSGTGFRNYDRTEIWRSETDNLSSAVKVGTSSSQQYYDTRGNTSAGSYYWVRFVSKAEVIGPFNSTSGSLGGPTQDPSYLISVLSETYGAEAVTNAPFYYVGTTTTINGVSIPQGTYIKSAFIANATITSAQIKDLTADKITAGYVSASIGFNGSSMYGAKLYSGGTVNVSYDAQGKVSGFTPVGSTFKVEDGVVTVKADSFQVSNGGTGSIVPFYVTGNVAYIDGARINNYIRSNVYIAGSTGFNIDAVSGSAEFNNALLRGALNVGAYTGWGWPTNGAGGGVHISSTGILAGNLNESSYFYYDRVAKVFQFGSSGRTLTIGPTGIATNMTLSGADGSFSGSLSASAVNAVNTINLVGDAVTIPDASPGTSSSSTGPGVSITNAASGRRIVIFGFFGAAEVGQTNSMNLQIRKGWDGGALTATVQYATTIPQALLETYVGYFSGTVLMATFVPTSDGSLSFYLTSDWSRSAIIYAVQTKR